MNAICSICFYIVEQCKRFAYLFVWCLTRHQPLWVISTKRHYIKVTTDTNNHDSSMTKHILPSNFHICYRIYLKLTEINGIGMPETIMVH